MWLLRYGAVKGIVIVNDKKYAGDRKQMIMVNSVFVSASL